MRQRESFAQNLILNENMTKQGYFVLKQF